MTDAANAAILQKIVEALVHKEIVSYIDVFSSTLLVYDVLLNLDLEIQHIWTRTWSLLTVLYTIQRYLPLFDTAGLVLHHQFGANLTIRACLLSYNIDGWCFVVGIVISEMVLTLRLWAVWNKCVPVTIGLVLFFLGCWVPCFVLFSRFLSAMQFSVPALPHFRGCFIAGGSPILYMCWVLMMIYDSDRMGGSSGLVNAVYRDGAIYYAFIFPLFFPLPKSSTTLSTFCLPSSVSYIPFSPAGQYSISVG
ncbi:hypothetical protein L218DRAFT_620160 [Marasmius fiardii PR-910]|nr:hypothetical protein L218DRAFT_620160 [Marasmius fiardii PR-910]